MTAFNYPSQRGNIRKPSALCGRGLTDRGYNQAMQVQVPPIVVRPQLPPLPESNVWWGPEALVGYATLALALATFLLVWETRRMRQGSDAAMRELGRHAAEAAQASRESAQAARESAAHAETMLQSRRAWVGVQRVTPVRASTSAEPVNGIIWFANSGDTPALDARIYHTYAIRQQFDRVAEDNDFEATHPVIGPKASVEDFIEFKYSDEPTRQALLEERVTLYWYGIVTYRDIFEQTRHTRFCYEYDVRKQDFKLCLVHNCAT